MVEENVEASLDSKCDPWSELYIFCWFSFHLQANTEILVGVKAELEEPKTDSPDVGRLEFFVDW